MSTTDNKIEFTTPVGRYVSGSHTRGNDRNERGELYVYKTGRDQGKNYLRYSFGIAIPKGAEAQGGRGERNWMDTEWGKLLWQVGSAFRADAWNLGDGFSWKVKDGDSAKPNQKGRAPNQNEGWPGHWILFFTANQLVGATQACQLFTLVGQPAGKPLPVTEPDSIQPGDYVQVLCVVEPNNETAKPGIYLNVRALCHIGYHPAGRISLGGAVDTSGFGTGAAPAGMTSTPPAGFSAPPALPPTNAQGAPALPGAPATAPMAPPTPQQPPAMPPASPPVAPPPNHAILQPPPVRTMTSAANGATYEQMIGAGWTDAQLIQHGMMTNG